MKNRKQKIILIIIIIISIIAVIFYKTYNKEHINVEKTSAKYTMTSQKLIDDFLMDEEEANKKYVNQIIQVTGTISEIDKVSITIKDVNSESTVQCNFSDKINNTNLKQGQKITIKGLCTGYLLDVVLIECVLIK